MAETFTVYVIDDDASMRDALSTLFEAAGYTAKTYERAEAFLDDCSRRAPGLGCAIVDVRLPGMNGLELNRVMNRKELPLPVIFITGHGDIPMAVSAVREGAFDFIEKPFDPTKLMELVNRAAPQSTALRDASMESAEVRSRYVTLTPREQEVMALVVEGFPTKTIASRLGISPRTAETHRARVMEKMQAPTVSMLLRQSMMLRPGELPQVAKAI
jgi:two-component system, LuxR family, response regulator FixJ